ncbi:hypothetical protein MUO93_01925 [Candidatus Bathyarchaeota archaeon]|jgi:hypothetical protein|nr:hypothetical protein [Candidatus Bathyarchaeota archaeon]
MSLVFSTESVEIDGRRVSGGLLELGNAVLALFWEGERPVLGSTTLTLPSRVSSQLIGDRDQLLGQMIGEYLANRFGKMTLVSTNLPPGSASVAGKALIEMTRRLAEKMSGIG